MGTTPSPALFLPPLTAFVASRALIFLILVCAPQAAPHCERSWEQQTICDIHIELDIRASINSLEEIFRSADARWYLAIAEQGYHRDSPRTDQPRNWVFFPLFPLLLRILAPLFGSTVLAGVLLSNAALLASLFLLSALLRAEGCSPKTTARSIWLLAFFPTSYFFSVPLTESTALLLLVGAFVLLRRGNVISAATVFALLTAARPTGLLVLPAFALALVRALGWREFRLYAALTIAPLGAAAYMVYLAILVGDPFAFSRNQPVWGRSGDLPLLLAQITHHPLLVSERWNFVLLNLAVAALSFAAAIYQAKNRHYEWALMIALPALVALSTGTLLSFTRLMMPLFPLVVSLAQWARTSSLERALLAVFAALLGIMTLLFALHFTPAMA